MLHELLHIAFAYGMTSVKDSHKPIAEALNIAGGSQFNDDDWSAALTKGIYDKCYNPKE